MTACYNDSSFQEENIFLEYSNPYKQFINSLSTNEIKFPRATDRKIDRKHIAFSQNKHTKNKD